jgi:phage terminase small subunit
MSKKTKRATAPAELTGGALTAWGTYTAELDKPGMLNTADHAALITLCRATAMKEPPPMLSL